MCEEEKRKKCNNAVSTQRANLCLFLVHLCVSLIIQSPLLAHSDTCLCEQGFSYTHLHALSVKPPVVMMIHTSPAIYSNTGDDDDDDAVSSLCEQIHEFTCQTTE